MARKYTNMLLEMVDENSINAEILIRDLLNYLSEAEVEQFMEQYGYAEIEDEEDE